MHYSFDFDYTLADSSNGIIICINFALKEIGYSEHSKEDIRQTIGASLTKALEFLEPDSNSIEASQFIQLVLQKADEVMLDNIIFYEDVEDTLSTLRKSGHFISIVSTKYKYRIEAALKRENMLHLVDNIIGGENVNNVKPDPEGLIKAISESGISASETFYIGDSATDGECASRANVKFVATTTGVTDLQLLEKWKPVKVIQNLNELVEFIPA